MHQAATLPAPDFAPRLGAILLNLAAIVARRFLRDPFGAGLIIPLYTLLTAAARRLDGAFARLAAGRTPRPRTPHPGGPHRPSALPQRHAWLVAALGPEAAICASQLQSLLAEPQAAAALAACPTARRTLAPIRRMLGLVPPRLRRTRPRPAPPRHAAPPTPSPGPAAPQPAARAHAPQGRAPRPWWLPPPRLRSG